MRISALQESIEVKVIDHVIYLGLYDETSDEPAYEFRLEPTGALQLVEQIINAVEKVLPADYATPLTPVFSFATLTKDPASQGFGKQILDNLFGTEEPTRPTLTTYPVDGLFDDEDEDAS